MTATSRDLVKIMTGATDAELDELGGFDDDPPRVVYRTKELRPPTWWEKGNVRYGVLSYSLWIRHAYWDFRGVKPPKKGKPFDPRHTWIERHWRWLAMGKAK